MHISDYDYDLPKALIAQEPLPERDASRLMIVDRMRNHLEHTTFRKLPEHMNAGDLLVVNDTRVIPARLTGHREGHEGHIEVLLLNPVRGRAGYPTFQALTRPARKIREGTELRLGSSEVPVQVVKEVDDKIRLLEFAEGTKVLELLDREGHVPLPPYIDRPDTQLDRERYQTIFAQRPGAVAAPTAALHFTPRVLQDLEARGVDVVQITLNVGLGTFAPVVGQDPREHEIEPEYYRIPPEAAEKITGTRRAGKRIVAVGTTVVRTLETAEIHDPRSGDWKVTPGDGWTEKYIYSPYEFHIVDALVTNFHLPRSTLLLLVSAFAGLELTRRAYHEAVERQYRFYSYGDAMLIL